MGPVQGLHPHALTILHLRTLTLTPTLTLTTPHLTLSLIPTPWDSSKVGTTHPLTILHLRTLTIPHLTLTPTAISFPLPGNQRPVDYWAEEEGRNILDPETWDNHTKGTQRHLDASPLDPPSPLPTSPGDDLTHSSSLAHGP
ncbi:hypothetical protein NQZ68_032773 [Dissostichus eleginoides]|nr:hypothetical protein NQZ68_032773 [Dissostichus eleginoides]